MMEEELNRMFNKVQDITAVCRATKSWKDDYSDVLAVGRTYNVTYIGVFRSSTRVMLEGMEDREFNSVCFDFFDLGFPTYIVDDYRFTAPYLRRIYEECKLNNSRGTIRPHLKDIEKKHDITILCAPLDGSRSRGWETPDYRCAHHELDEQFPTMATRLESYMELSANDDYGPAIEFLNSRNTNACKI